MMTTADMALKMDPEFRKISERFRNDHEAFKDAFARAWFKLTHRDMGPKVRYLGPEVPAGGSDLAGPGPGRHHACRTPMSRAFKSKILGAGFSIGQLVKTAWASASTYRRSDHRGGANGARIRLAPQKDWAVNEPEELAEVSWPRSTSCAAACQMADAIVLAGTAAVEKAAKDAGFDIDGAVHRRARRCDAGVDRRRKLRGDGAGGRRLPQLSEDQAFGATEELLLDRAQLLGLSVPEMTVLLGGLRVLGANYKDRPRGRLHDSARAS